MARYKQQLEQKRETLSRLARIGLSKGGKTLPESKSSTRYSEIENVEVLLIRGKRREGDAVNLRLLDNSSTYDSEGGSLGSASVLITAKVIAVKTGELVFSDMSKGIDFGSEREMAMGRAVKNAATPLVKKMSSVIINKKNSIDEEIWRELVLFTGVVDNREDVVFLQAFTSLEKG